LCEIESDSTTVFNIINDDVAFQPSSLVITEAWLVREYGSAERGHGFRLHAERFDFEDAPIEEAWQTLVWLREEEALIQEFGADAYMAGLELSSDATAINFKGRSLHPVYANLPNRPVKASPKQSARNWCFQTRMLSFAACSLCMCLVPFAPVLAPPCSRMLSTAENIKRSIAFICFSHNNTSNWCPTAGS
jgi:hypothetical protein